ncbi:MAG: hypothetical protein K9G46_03200 [Flavobacteriales bacterium]|jgi:hypothetical protein|nr:hypothetical protein [Flavobacteriales bacterium]
MRLFSLLLLILLTTAVFGQVNNPEFEVIAKKYEKEAWVSALESAEALIDNDKHRKSPEPYLWASMCFYEISKSEDQKIIDQYKLPMRDALKFAGKAASKDKNGDIVKDNQEYFDLMRKEGIAVAQAYEKEEDYRKASYTYKQLQEFAPNDPYIQFVKGVTDIRLSSMYEAEREIKASFPILEASYRNLDYVPDPISSPLLKPAVEYYADYLINNSFGDSAKTVLLSARVFFPLDENIKKKLQDL